MKRILQVLAQKPSSTGSGIYFQALVKEMKRRGYPQAALAATTQEEVGAWEWDGEVPFYPVIFQRAALPFPIPGMSDRMPYPSTKYREMGQEMHRCWKEAFRRVVDQAVHEFQPDIILSHHLWLLSAYIKEWHPGIPMIAISHGTDLRQLELSPRFAQEVIEGCRGIEKVFALNPFQKDRIHNLYAIEKERIIVMGNGYDGDLFYPDPQRRGGDRIELVYTGKISNAKGVPSLLRAFDLLELPQRELKLTLIGGGDGEEYQGIHRFADTIDKPIEFTGTLPQKEVAQRFRESDIFILPSFYEGLPLVLLEALACGLRVVTSDLPGIREWLGESLVEEGLISYVPLPRLEGTDQPLAQDLPSYERALAEKIGHAIKELDKKGNAGINHKNMGMIREWSWKHLFERMETYL